MRILHRSPFQSATNGKPSKTGPSGPAPTPNSDSSVSSWHPSTNGYTDGVPFYGLVSNAIIIRTFNLDDLTGFDNQDPLQRFSVHATFLRRLLQKVTNTQRKDRKIGGEVVCIVVVF
jgi:hypothetical protein